MKKILILAFIFLFLPANSIFAFSKVLHNKVIYGHKSPDGTISFLGQAGHDGRLFTNAYNNLFLIKVYPTDGEYYYYFHVDVRAGTIKNSPVSEVIVKINDQPVEIAPFEDFPSTYENKIFRAYFKIPSTHDFENMVREMKTLDLILMTGDKILKKAEMSQRAQSSFKELLNVKKEEYIGEYRLVNDLNDYDKTTYHPVIFIPDVSKEAVTKALFVENANFVEKNGVYKFKDFVHTWNYKNNEYNSLVFQGKYRDNLSPHITITNQEYKNGVWINADIITLDYTPASKTTPSYIEHILYNENRESKSYWINSKVDGTYYWAKILLNVYYNLHGKYDYGISWNFIESEDKNVQASNFIVTSVNTKDFPSLSELKVGDRIISIDGHLTKQMKPITIDYMLTANGQKAAITVTTSDNIEKTITIVPKFISNNNPKDYNKLYSLIPINLIKETETQYKFYFYYFHPIEKKLFGF